jgi:hypothetical protein
VEREDAAHAESYLPDGLIEELLDQTRVISDAIRGMFEGVTAQRDEMRTSLLGSGRVRLAGDLPRVPHPSVAAVDGALAIEQSLGADTALVVALGVEGLAQEEKRQWKGVRYAHWERVLPHKGEDARSFALGVMAALEIEILANAPHDVVILDGSHATPIVALIKMLAITDPDFMQAAYELCVDHNIPANLYEALQRTQIVGMVKYDASRHLAEKWLDEFKIPCDDRAMMTILLEADEYTDPSLVGHPSRYQWNWNALQKLMVSGAYPHSDFVQSHFGKSIEYADQRQILLTYYKPHDWSPAYRVEVKREVAEDSEQLSRVLTAVREQVVSSEMREPYPQYLADVMAKSVSKGMSALRAAIFHELSIRGAHNYMRFVTQSYRTEV